MIDLLKLGEKIYNLKNPREVHRFIVFLIRCFFHSNYINQIQNFFVQSKLLQTISEKYPFVYEQMTRAFFYYNSTYSERIKLIENHMEFLTNRFEEHFLLKLYDEQKIELWRAFLDDELGEMKLVLSVEPGQRKEGLLTLMLELLNHKPIYQILFWISRNNLIALKNSPNVWALWIGAIQGSNFPNAVTVIKRITKLCHGYRPKNLILHIAQKMAMILGIKKIFAVTNEGYYANNHVRVDRKLKTSFDDFWRECGGKSIEDKRFFELPLEGHRKTFEEIPTHKRALYRRRFSMLDELDAKIEEEIRRSMRENCNF